MFTLPNLVSKFSTVFPNSKTFCSSFSTLSCKEKKIDTIYFQYILNLRHGHKVHIGYFSHDWMTFCSLEFNDSYYSHNLDGYSKSIYLKRN